MIDKLQRELQIIKEEKLYLEDKLTKCKHKNNHLKTKIQQECVGNTNFVSIVEKYK